MFQVDLRNLGNYSVQGVRLSDITGTFIKRFRWLFQLLVLHFGFFQDGDVGVGVFLERKEIFVGGERPDAGGIGVRPLRRFRL
jgi:hypothetical protein